MKREKANKNININQKIVKTSESGKNNISKPTISKKIVLFWIVAITVLTPIAYYPAFNAELTTWDDDRYIETNPYLKDLSAENIKTLFSTETYYMGNYHPLVMISLSIDYAIAGDDGKEGFNPFIFHFVNILLHIFVSILVFYFVLLLFKNVNIAGIAAALFAVHTLHVESVAWVSERKDVLYALFFVASLIFYVKYTDSEKKYFYLISLLLFILSLFSKGQAVSLSVTLFAVDFLRNRKLLSTKVIIEKIPFLILAIVFGLIAVKAQSQSEALGDEDAYNFIQRILIGSFAFSTYILKLILPVNLSAINPYPDILHKTIPAYFSIFLIPTGLVIYLFFKNIKKNKETAFSIAFFIINIILLLQFIPVGSAIYADRYAYIPSIGFFIILALVIVKIGESRSNVKKTLFYASMFYIGILTLLTFNRTKVWNNSFSLWQNTVEESPKAVVAWNNLGNYYENEAKRLAENKEFQESIPIRKKAIECFTNAITTKPDYSSAFYNRGVSYYEYYQISKDSSSIFQSIKDFSNAVLYNKLFDDAYHYRANCKSEIQRFDEAIMDFDIAISIDQKKALFYVNRGICLGKMGKLDKSIEDFNTAEKLEPLNESIYSNRGLAKAFSGKYQEAILDYNRAIELKPDFLTAYYNRAFSEQKLGNFKNAIKDLTFVLQKDSKFTDAYNIRAYCYEILKMKDEACADYSESAKQGNAFAKEKIKIYCK